MNFRNFIAVVATVLAMVSCHKDPVQPPLPELSIDKSSLEQFSYQAGASQEVTLKVNREWSIDCKADWLAFDYDRTPVEVGVTRDVKVKITPLTNRVGNVRKSVVRFKTSSLYVDLLVTQGPHPDNAPSLIYYNGFGEDLAGLDNPLVGDTDCWRAEEGVATGVRYYVMSSGKLSVRNSGTSNSAVAVGQECYVGASGSNHLFFGTSAPAFDIGNIPVHPKLSMLEISFGVFHIDGVSLNRTDFLVYISKDGKSWIPLRYEVVSEYDEPKWSLCKAEIFFAEASFETLYVRFAPVTASKYRFDDIRIGSDPDRIPPTGGLVDWTAGAVELTLGTEVE